VDNVVKRPLLQRTTRSLHAQRPGACRQAGRRVVSAFIATAFAQGDAESAKAQWRRVSDQLRPKLPKLAGFLDEAEIGMLTYMSFPVPHRAKLHSTDPIERLNGEIKRSGGSWVRSCSNRTTNGPCSGRAT
jgi:hypothetical protein